MGVPGGLMDGWVGGWMYDGSSGRVCFLLPLPSPSLSPSLPACKSCSCTCKSNPALAVPQCMGVVLAHSCCGPLVLDPPTSTPGEIPFGGDRISTVLGGYASPVLPVLPVLPSVRNGTVTFAASRGNKPGNKCLDEVQLLTINVYLALYPMVLTSRDHLSP